MAYKMSMNPSSDPSLSQKQTQRLMMSYEMQQALNLLQMPIMELAEQVEHELEENPVLELIEEEGNPEMEEHHDEDELNFETDNFEVLKEIDDSFTDMMNDQPKAHRTQEDDKKQSFLESLMLNEQSLNDLLLTQAREVINDPEKLQIAEIIIGNLEESGLFQSDLAEIAKYNHLDQAKLEEVLKIIQTFDPPGIAALTIREALLTQLRAQKKERSLAYEIIDKYYDELIHHKIPLIQKKLKVDSHVIQETIENEIKHLNLHPAAAVSTGLTPYITPDVTIKEIDGRLEIMVNNESIPPLRLNRSYLKLLQNENCSEETKKFVLSKLNDAKWFMKTIHQRGNTLQRITELLVQKNRDFFLSEEGKMVPLTMKTLAHELELHESTIARAVMNKYVDSPRGLLPLRSFFNSTFETTDGESLSSRTIKDLIVDLIQKEDKTTPLSDDKIAEIIRMKGISCARRTVAKFRSQLQIGNQHQRRKF